MSLITGVSAVSNNFLPKFNYRGNSSDQGNLTENKTNPLEVGNNQITIRIYSTSCILKIPQKYRLGFGCHIRFFGHILFHT